MRFRRGVLSIMIILGASTVATAPAQASVSKSYCKRYSYAHVVKKYPRGKSKLWLRCGKSSWGFKHITHRWNARFDKMIAVTIEYGEAVGDYQQDGGTAIYALFNSKCSELFRVIYNSHAYLGHLARPQGIITAYYSRPSSAVTPMSSGLLSYRRDCKVYENI